MCKIRPQLTERIAILTINNNNNIKTLSYKKYCECYKTRAKIQQLGYTSGDKKIYNVEFLLPTVKLKNVPFAGIVWNGEEYLFTSPLKICKNGCISGIVKSIM